MRLEIIKMENVTCKGFVKALSNMLSKVEGINDVEIDHLNTDLTLTIETTIPREDLIKQLIASNSIKPETSATKPKKQSCGNCVIKKLKLI